jgi:tRNA uracil 4-sulfurtransferase
MHSGEPQLLVRYYEIALKGKNRRTFTERLRENLRLALGPLASGPPRSLAGRISVPLSELALWPLVRERVSSLYGIANFSLGIPCERSLEALCAAVERHWPHESSPRSFRVTCRRSDKRFALTSPEIERQLGAFVHERFALPASMDAPDLNVWVEVLSDRFFVYFGKLPGAGGLPSGSSGRVVALLSGGIDSPVAAARIMRRGAAVRFVHFSGQPFHDRSSERKARELARVLVRSQLAGALDHVPFGEVQRRVVVGAPAALRVVL